MLVLTEPIGSGSRALAAEAAADRGGLDRIADRRAGAMRLDEGEREGAIAARE